MMSPSRRRLLKRIWITLSIMIMAATCAERLRPYLKGIAGARDGGAPRVSHEAALGQLRLASWNLHWLDVEGRGHDRRGRADYEALRRYARELDADIIAVQEVASEAALELVFPREVYGYHLAERGGPQRTGFVFKRSLQVRHHADLSELALETLRAGSDMSVTVAGRELRLLAIHLKAYCVTGSLARADKDCVKLRAQLPILEAWVDARAREGTPFVVLGDFNRVLSAKGEELFGELDDGDPKGLTLRLASARTHSSCATGKRVHALDHMLLGGPAGGWLGADGLTEIAYAPEELLAGRKLSDHCPIRITLTPPAMR